MNFGEQILKMRSVKDMIKPIFTWLNPAIKTGEERQKSVIDFKVG